MMVMFLLIAREDREISESEGETTGKKEVQSVETQKK